MSDFTRFAIYYLPPDGPLAQAGAAWLGWDASIGAPVRQPAIGGVAEITATPRKYGFHATLKPPFRMAPAQNVAALSKAVGDLAGRHGRVTLDALALSCIGRFLALVPVGDVGALSALAAACVRDLDAFRAPAPPDDIARRRAAGLTPAQDALLLRWGYPYVFDEFQFHMTLSGSLDTDTMEFARLALAAHLPPLPAPFLIDSIALVGERADGNFQMLQRCALAG